jgi:hypothetical protein
MDNRAFVLALVVVLAGCGALVGGSERTTTVTPAPVPEVTTTAPSPLPPGISGGRLTDVDALVRAHVAALEGRSYTLYTRVRQGDRTGERVLRVEDPWRYYYHDTTEPAGGRTEFVDGTYRYQRSTRAGLQFDRSTATNLSTQYGRALGAAVRSHLSVGNATVAETRLDGDRHYEVRIERDEYADFDGQNYTVRMVVRPDGLVRSFHVSYVRDVDGRRTTIERSVTYTEFGTTTVDTPEWVSDRWNLSA